LLTLLIAGLSCCAPDPLSDGLPTDVVCAHCHGGEDNAAPPLAIDGSTETTSRGVGAHQAHLSGGELRAGLECSECHVVPEAIAEEGHIDTLPAELTWGALATAAGAEPTWTHASSTCASTYCHGGTLSGGSNTSPSWTVVNGTQDACGTCHGAPPPAPHPSTHECQMCHPGTITPEGTIDLESGNHINGIVDVTIEGCSSCHGNENNAAPPKSLNGSEDTGTVEVGAHQAHLSGGTLRGAISCDECHLVPDEMDSDGHFGEAPADLTWGILATMGDLEPEWNRTGATCASTYCHGGTLTGGSNTKPKWTTVDGSQDACGSCHGNPPPAPHPQNDQCNVCHPNTVTVGLEIDMAGGRHIDGKVDGPGASCSACHGSNDNPAPPPAVDGETETTDIAVGAHQIHLSGGKIRKGVNCAECHVIPGNLSDATHMDVAPAEVVFGELASGDGEPIWTYGSASCSSTYCHGSTLSGGEVEAPVWTVVDGSQTACSSCHGNPPPEPHPQVADCNMCHPETVMADGTIDLEARRHIDGEINVIGSTCNACHGNDINSAPPLSLAGEEDTSVTEVGAHQAHLIAGTYRESIACNECHVVPGTMDSPGHLDDGPAEVTWGTLATAAGADGEWDRETTTCSSTYCHGSTLSGGANTAPDWTVVDGTEVGCGTCHGFPPPLPHSPSMTCSNCHEGTVGANGAIDFAGGLHINGEVEIGAGACNSCHGSASGPAPPSSVGGETKTTFTEVGAHQAHVTDGPLKSEMWCSECHVVPTTISEEGHMDSSPAEVTWGELALLGGIAADWDRDSNTCSSTYCHGATLSGGSNTTPVWTTVDGSQSACGTCHGWPPPVPHPQSTQCFLCHPETVGENGKILIPNNKHVDGELQFQFGDCNSCHGNDDNPAPPQSMSGSNDTNDVEVGAHQAHVKGGQFKSAMACGNCHIVPADAGAEGHLDASPAEVTFNNLAIAGEMEPSWDHDAESCSSTYCHGGTLAGGIVPEPVWTDVGTDQIGCGACHGKPPEAPHPDMSDCHSCHYGLGTECSKCHEGMAGPSISFEEAPDHCHLCHGDTVDEEGLIKVEDGLHIDGEVQFTFDAYCGGCHALPPDTGTHKVHFNALADSAKYGGTGGTEDTNPGGNAYGFNCGNCHPMDGDSHANGVLNAGGGSAEVDLSPAGAPVGSLKSMNAAQATYIPGDEVFTDENGMKYTQGTCNNIYCHSSKRYESGPVPAPGTDFPFNWIYPIEYPDFEVSWQRIYQSPQWGTQESCDGCHGFPPRTTFEEVEAGVGDSHSWIDDQGFDNLHAWNHGYGPMPCAICHTGTVTDHGENSYEGEGEGWAIYGPIPISGFAEHVNGTADILFTQTPYKMKNDQDLTSAEYDTETRSCSSVSCHEDETTIEWGAPYRWWNMAECNKCHQM
jgi:predicted CxxxxCH...CXXCH cytochrome family protein